MKRTIAILLLAVMMTQAIMLQSCEREEFKSKETDTESVQNETDSGDKVEAKHPETSISSYSLNLDNLKMDAQPGITNSTLRHTADISSYKTTNEVSSLNSAPVICMDGEYTYLIRRYPEEFSEAEQYLEFMDAKKYFSEIEIYKNHDYSKPCETVQLEVPDDISFKCNELSYDSKTERFYLTISKKLAGDEKSSLNVFVFTRSGEFVLSKKVSENTLDDVKVNKGDIYWLKANGRLARINIETDEDITAGENVQQYFISDGEIYYISAELNANYQTEIWLYAYDSEAKQSSRIMQIKTDERFETANYDAATNTVFFSNFDSLCSYRDGEVKTLVITKDTFLHVIHVYGGQVVIGVGHNQLAMYQVPKNIVSLEDQQITLRVCKFGQTFVGGNTEHGLEEGVIETMNATGISVRDEITYITNNVDEYINTMAKKLLAGDTDFDLFYIDSEMATLFKKEYFADLGKYDGLNKYMDALLPGLKGLCTIDDKLALVPTAFYGSSMVYHKSLLEKEHELPALYRDLWTNLPELKEGAYYMTLYLEMEYLQKWFNQLAANYMEKIISDDTAKQDLEMLYTNAIEMSEYESVYIGRNAIEYDNYIGYGRLTNDPYTEYNPDENDVYVPFLKLGEEYKYAVEGRFIAVNPASPNKELAAAYLVYYMDNMKKGASALTKYYFEGGYDPDDKYAIAQDRYDVFKETVADSVREVASTYYDRSEYIEHIRTRFSEMQDGKITAEQAAEQTLRFLKMMRDE